MRSKMNAELNECGVDDECADLIMNAELNECGAK